MRILRPATGAALAAVLTACGSHVVYDTSLMPVRNPLITATVENGWLVVDSTDVGIRAVVELQLEGPNANDEYLARHVPRLHCTISGEHIPAKLLREGPRCEGRPIGAATCPTGATPEECDLRRSREDPVCIYTIRAEFLFAEMPHLNENTHYFTFAQTDAPVNWVVADRSR